MTSPFGSEKDPLLRKIFNGLGPDGLLTSKGNKKFKKKKNNFDKILL